MWQPGWEGSLGEKGCPYQYMAKFLGRLSESITALLISHTPIQNKKFNEKKEKKDMLVMIGVSAYLVDGEYLLFFLSFHSLHGARKIFHELVTCPL